MTDDVPDSSALAALRVLLADDCDYAEHSDTATSPRRDYIDPSVRTFAGTAMPAACRELIDKNVKPALPLHVRVDAFDNEQFGLPPTFRVTMSSTEPRFFCHAKSSAFATCLAQAFSEAAMQLVYNKYLNANGRDGRVGWRLRDGQ